LLIPHFAGMRFFPELVAEKHRKRVFHILVPRNGIVGRLRIGDQIVYPRPFLRAEIKRRAMQASSKALDIASVAEGPKAVLSVKCFRIGIGKKLLLAFVLTGHRASKLGEQVFFAVAFPIIQTNDVDLPGGHRAR
jgi:hypothetical protein